MDSARSSKLAALARVWCHVTGIRSVTSTRHCGEAQGRSLPARRRVVRLHSAPPHSHTRRRSLRSDGETQRPIPAGRLETQASADSSASSSLLKMLLNAVAAGLEILTSAVNGVARTQRRTGTR
jgi:hypothetical protein